MSHTSHVGTKFHEDGSVRPFPGNTVVAMIPAESWQHSLLCKMQDILKSMECASCFAMLPPGSFHMTVIEGVCDQVRLPERWPAGISIDTPLDEIRRIFIEKLSGIEHHPRKFQMKLEKFDATGSNVIKLNLAPADEQTAVSLNTYRDTFARATGLRFPDHHTYGFHTTLAYKLLQLDPSQAQELDNVRGEIEDLLQSELGILTTGPARLCWFPDMFRFFPEVRGQRSEVRGRRSEVGGRRSE